MKRVVALCAVVIAVSSLVVWADEDVRVWSAADGSSTVEAALVEVNNVELRKKDGSKELLQALSEKTRDGSMAELGLMPETERISVQNALSRVSEYERIYSQWMNLISSEGRDTDAQEYLLTKGEAALEVMLDLLYEYRPMDLFRVDVDVLVYDLVAEDAEIRNTARRQLEALGANVVDFLEEYAQYPDPEIVKQVEAVLAAIEEREQNSSFRRSALEHCTTMLDVSWPLDQIRNVAKKNLDRLARVKSVEYNWNFRPLGPLLGSLRYSEDKADRELLAEFAGRAEDGAAKLALSLMENGLKGRTRLNMAAHWDKMPEHDYSAFAFSQLDPSRPEVFKQAMYAAPMGQKLQTLLHEAIPNITDDTLKEEVYTYLWHFMRDPAAQAHFFEALESPDFKTFSRAVSLLTDSNFSYQGGEIIPKLRPALRGEDKERRKLVLQQLDSYLGEISVNLAATEAAPFLISEDADERKIAQDVLIRLQKTGWGDVLGKISAEHEIEGVRAEAKMLYEKWKVIQQENQSL